MPVSIATGSVRRVSNPLAPAARPRHKHLQDLGRSSSTGNRQLKITVRHDCVLWAERARELYDGYFYTHLTLAAAHAQLGRIDEARRAVRRALAIQPDVTIKFTTDAPLRFPERNKSWIEGLRKAELPEG
jgi:hypothetical protein